MTTATLSRLTLLAKARRDSVPSAERLVGEAARRLGIDWQDCDPSDRIRLLHAVRLLARAWLRREAEKAVAAIEADASKALFGKARKAAERFFDKGGKFIRNMVVAAGLAMLGPGEPTRVEAEAINRVTAEQLAYLDNFRDEVLDERKPLLPARAEQYGGAVWGSGHDIVRAVAIAEAPPGSREWAEHLGEDAPCGGCVDRLKRGVVPIGTLRPIGQTECRQNCHCVIHYVDAHGNEYHVGKRPPSKSWGSDGASLKSFNPSQSRDGHGRWTSTGGGRYRHNTAIALGGTSASTHAATQRVNSGSAGPGASKRRYRKRKVRSDKHGEILGRIHEHRRKVGQKLRRQRQQGAARRAKETTRLGRQHADELARIDRAHERRGTTGSAEHMAERGRAESAHARERIAHHEASRLDRDIERVEHRHEAAIARQHHRDTEAIYLRRRHERLTERE